VVATLYIEPGSPWGNGYLESSNGKLRDELLAREVFDTLPEAKVLVARWRRHYNAVRPHSAKALQCRAAAQRVELRTAGARGRLPPGPEPQVHGVGCGGPNIARGSVEGGTSLQTALHPLLGRINSYLVRWARTGYKWPRRHPRRATH